MGPFCEPRIIALANRRFVPFAFDLHKRGGIADADARKAVIAAEPKLTGGAIPTPEVLFMTHEGKVLGKVSNYASEEQFIVAMQKVLTDHPEYNLDSEREKSASSALEKGRIAYELLDFKRAKKELIGSKQEEAHYLLAKIARYEKNWPSFENALSQISSKTWEDDVIMEKIRMHASKREFALALKLSATIPAKSKRYSEAQYFRGVAQYQLGKPKLATATWKQLITSQNAHDNWIYRADWAYCEIKQKASRSFSTFGKRISLLGRIGYMGRNNPDLIKPFE